MSSRGCTKTYSRKVNTVTPASIQFDKLFRENSNRPSAAKSAGTVGKWGITSFTSLRSTNINGRRDDIHGSFGAKRMKIDYGNQNARVSSGKDPFSFDTDAPDARTDSPAGATTAAAPVVKPKKFFKSRNVVAPPATEERDSAIYRQVPDSQIGRGGRGHGKHQVTTAASAAVKSIQKSSLGSLATTSSSVAASGINAVGKKPIADPMDPSLEDSPSKPPIVLRICKGTAQLLCGDTQELAEPGDQQPDTYRITTPMTMSTKIMDMDRKSLVSETSASKERHRPVVTTVSIPLEHSDMRRTTRSRSKNLQLGEAAPTTTIPTFSTISTMSTTMVTPVVTSSPPPSPPAATISQTSGSSSSSSSSSHGLSLTLRKSVTDSNNTLISHYDIVKTDGYSCKPLIEPLIGRDQPLPTTTQELIDILSSDSDPRPLVSNPPEEPQPQVEVQAKDEKPKQQELVEMEEDQEVEEEDEEEEEEEEEETPEPPKIKIKPVEPPLQVSETLPTPMTISETVTENTTTTTMTTTTATTTITSTSSTASPVTELQPLLPPPPPSAEVEEEKDAGAKSLVDQDWFSGSEDSETPPTSTPGTVGTLETVVEVTSAVKPLASTVKKGSIFKSRSAGATNGKRRALYKHKWSETNTSDGTTATGSTGSVPSAHIPSLETAPYTEEFEDTELTRVVTYSENDKDLDDDDDVGTECVRSVRCGKKVKRFYTVVKNVKKAHQIQESGEFQEFNDDVEYILDTLRENNPNATRCLSAIRLASKCMAPAFRMHVRAHGTVAKFFKALHDATKDQSLGLCTATVMFVLSQDRLAMDLDRDCLELMLSLLESDASHKDALDDCGLSRAELLKNKEKVRQLCADIQAQGHAKHLNLDNITVGQLAMETLLSLTSKRAGEWFKEELRELGGLEHIVKTIRDCHRNIDANDITRAGWSDPLLDKLRKVDRCLRVLENVTHMNEENQIYLLKYDDAVLVKTLASLYYLCGQEIVIYPTIDPSDKSSTGAVIRECLFAIIKVLINLTHRFNRQSFGSKSVGTQTGVIECSLHLILGVSDSLPEEKRFDMMMLGLILLINLVEQCDDNKKLLMELKSPSNIENIFDAEESGVEALIDLFYKQEELARAEEQKTDAILDGKKDSEQTETVSTTAKSQEEFIEETVTKLLQKAGRHMEHTLIGAYVVLLLGYLIMDNKDYELLVRNRLPDGNFATMVTVLQKFFNFMNLTASNEISSCGIAATEKVIKFLKMSDARIEEERNELPLPALEDSSSTATLDMTSP